MEHRPGSIPARTRVFGLVLVLAALVIVASLGSPGDAKAAGHWTTGILTSNGVDDEHPQLSQTHLVWAQKTGSGWAVRLRQLSSGATTTIVDLPAGSPDVAPDLSVAGDYATAFSRGDDQWFLYQLSTGILTAFQASGTTIVSVAGTDGDYVVLILDDGDGEIVAYDLVDHGWTKITNDDVNDFSPRLDRGRIVWEKFSPALGRMYEDSVMFRDLGTGTLRTICTRWHDSMYTVGMSAQIGGDWVGYRDLASGKISLYRLADGLTMQPGGSADLGWILTDDYAVWTEPREGGAEGDSDLYAFDLTGLQKIRLTSDGDHKSLVAADGRRAIYAESTGEAGFYDLMAIDLGTMPSQPHQLVQGARLASGGWGAGINFSMSGDLLAAVINDGTDNEIAWALWVEEEEPPTFTDVPAGHPYREAVEGLAARGIVSGYDGTTFGVSDLVKRQQFAKMIVGTLGLTPVEADFPHPDVPFTDLGADDPGNLYPHEFIAVCARNQITLGKTPTTFDPYAYITRAQVISMVVRAADRLAPGTLATPGASWMGVLSSADPTHGSNIKRAEFNGLLAGIQGPAGTLAGWLTGGYATRGEVAQILWNLLSKLE